MRTQKARGILMGLHQIMQKYPKLCEFYAPMSHKLISSSAQLEAITSYPYFARPCPVTPRHGFVESKLVYTTADLSFMWNEAMRYDPKAEIILGSYMSDVKYNTIYIANGNIAIGKGNDGATGGKNSISFPVAPTKFTKKMRKDSGISDKDEVYLESIYQNNWWYLTQARGGPALEGSMIDYIPEKVNVNLVIIPDYDLLTWEHKTKHLKPGTVVYGDGHTLASHAAVHCVLNKVPFITSHVPKIGDILQPTLKNPAPNLTRDSFRHGIVAADKMLSKISDHIKVHATFKEKFYFALSVLHNWAYIRNSKEAGWMLGAACMTLVRICSALCFGEHRHMFNGEYGIFKEKERNKVYVHAAVCDHNKLPLLTKVMEDFYSREWSGGFGGPPWATCCWYTINLLKNITKIYNSDKEHLEDKESAAILGIVNRLVNLAHNNGWWFNKFSTKEDFDFIAENPGLATLCVSNIYYDIYNGIKAHKQGSLYDRMSEPEEVDIPAGKDKDGRLVWVGIFNRDHDHGDFFYFREDGRRLTIYKKSVGSSSIDAIRKIREDRGLPVGAMHVLKVNNNDIVVPGKTTPLKITSLFKKKKEKVS